MNTRKLLVDPQATPETVALFYKLKRLAQRGQTLIGQQDPNESVNSIKGKDGTLSPVIFRPFHEFDGD